MKRKTLKRGSGIKNKKEATKMKGTLASHFHIQLGVSSLQQQSSASTSSSIPSSRFQNLLESVAEDAPLGADVNGCVDDKDFILSQDFFCTPDYITPDNPNMLNSLDGDMENVHCPESPQKQNTIKSKKRRQEGFLEDPLSPTSSDYPEVVELAEDTFDAEVDFGKTTVSGTEKTRNYLSRSAIALRCRIMPPPCFKNPYQKDASDMDIDPLGNQRAKCAGLRDSLQGSLITSCNVGFFPAMTGGNGLSRYYTDFHEIEQIGSGHFSRVFKVLKRIDGCFYAIKHSTKQLHQDTERRKALMEVQALAALGFHENIVGYYSSWFEDEQLYIQLELCDHSLSISKASQLYTEGEVLKVFHQIAKALQFIHERGIAHLDVKPDNIYVKSGVYKLGDFGCATLLDSSLPVEEGDARYMPQEILNEKYDHLDKVDIFSLGASIYELIKGSPRQESGSRSFRGGKLPLLPGHSLQFQNLLKVMMDSDPVRRPSAKELVENPIFDRLQKNAKA